MTKTSRRLFLKTATSFATAACALPLSAQASTRITDSIVPDVQPDLAYPREKPLRLFIKNKKTGDVFNDVFQEGPLVYLDALEQIDFLMRDWRRNEIMQIDRGLIELLARLQREIGYKQPITMMSGYRSEATNTALRKASRNVAKDSYHLRGMAVDLRIKNVTTDALRRLAVKESTGGVGFYPGRNFVHLDTGPLRAWRR